MMNAQLEDPRISVKPSQSLLKYIKALPLENDMPLGILNIHSNENIDVSKRKLMVYAYLVNDDHVFMNNLNSASGEITYVPKLSVSKNDKFLNLEDLHWIYKRVDGNNKNSENKSYFHEIFEGSEVVLPKNVEVPRNPELEKRCMILKAQHQNKQYKAMTKNVDNVRQKFPEDTMAYQTKQLNRHLISVIQFLLSVAAGFLFGFAGVELLVGRLDFGFRLILGIICGLIVAIAELYFLAKKLNEDFSLETKTGDIHKASKIN